MNAQNYHNYYKDYSNPVAAESNSFVFRVKRAILEEYEVFNKELNRKVKRAGSRRFTNKLLDKRIPAVYKEAAKKPVDENKIVFVELRHPVLTNSFEVVFDELTNNYDYVIHTHFLLTNNTLRADYAKRVLNAVEDIATAKYVFLNEGSNAISAIPLREETKVIQLWHGCGAFKKFGFSTADLIFGADRKEQLKHPVNKNYSLVTVSSPEVIWAYKEAMNLPENSNIVQATGSSRTDIFYNDEFINKAYEHVYEIVPQAKGKKIILYAPTFRGRVAKATTPDMLNVKMFRDSLKDDYVLLFKHHPLVKMPPVIPEEYRDFAMDVGNVLSIEELLCVSDICISDYSSLVFEYSIFEKPLIFFAYDLDEYFDWRGFYYDYYELAPGLIAKTNFEMIDYIKNIDERFDKKAVQDFRYKFMRSCDGNATQRILEYAFDDLEKHKKPCEKFEHFYTVPKAQGSAFPYFRRIEAIREAKEYALEKYPEFAKQPVGDSILALDIRSSAVRYMLEKSKDFRLTFVKGGESLDEVIEKIATAKYIIIDQPNTLLDSIELRDETKVVLIPTDSFPLNKIGYASKEYRSGLLKEQYELAPFCKNVNMLVTPSEETFKLVHSAVGEKIEPLCVGDIKSDVYFKNGYKQRILNKLFDAAEEEFNALYPESEFKMRENFEGKKIVTYVAEREEPLDDSTIYEYICRDYVFLKHFDFVNDLAPKTTLVYYEDKIIDVSKYLTKFEALAIADIAIGGFDSTAFSFIASGKPFIVFSSNAGRDLINTESFLDIKSICPTPICSSMSDVARIIENIDKYNYSRYDSLKEKYLAECDGKSTKKLLKALS